MASKELSKIKFGGRFEMNVRDFLNILYGKVDDGYIGIPYIENIKVVTKWFHSSELDDIAKCIIEEGKKHNTYYCICRKESKGIRT